MLQNKLVCSYLAIPLGHINKHINVIVIPSHVFVFDQPFQLLFYHLFRWQKHILQNIDKFRLIYAKKKGLLISNY